MKLKKLFSFTDKNQIWRLLISKSDKLIVETRNTDKKEVFFHSYDILKGKKIFKGLQLDEKFWIGIEAVYDDIIYFHLFAKPNMPEHKKIIAFDLNKSEIIWENDDLTFLSVLNNCVYAFKKKFEGRDIYVLDHKTGAITADLGNDFSKLNEIMNSARSREDFSDYLYPGKFNEPGSSPFGEVITDEINGKAIAGNVEFIEFGELLFFNYYLKAPNNLLDNVFVVYNIEKKKKVFSETINRGLNSFSPDSFFCYKKYLLLLKNKIEIILFKIH